MNRTIEEFVNRHWVKKIPKSTFMDVGNKENEVELLKEAGFTEVASLKRTSLQEIVAQNKQQIKLKQLQERILLRKPSFEQINLTMGRFGYSDEKLVGIAFAFMCSVAFLMFVSVLACGGALLCSIAFFCLTWFNGENLRYDFDAIRLGRRFLASIPLKDYTGEVPISVANVAIQANKEGLQPKVWTITSKSNIRHLIKGEQIMRYDPLLVGYHRDLVDYVILLAIWGEDIEDLDKIFASGSSNQKVIE